jgi:hypothetical protein
VLFGKPLLGKVSICFASFFRIWTSISAASVVKLAKPTWKHHGSLVNIASQSSIGDDAELDFLSASFDPLRALYATSSLTLPNPRALPLDNLSKCRGILPLEDPEWRVKDPASHQLLKVCCVHSYHADPGAHL